MLKLPALRRPGGGPGAVHTGPDAPRLRLSAFQLRPALTGYPALTQSFNPGCSAERGAVAVRPPARARLWPNTGLAGLRDKAKLRRERVANKTLYNDWRTLLMRVNALAPSLLTRSTSTAGGRSACRKSAPGADILDSSGP